MTITHWFLVVVMVVCLVFNIVAERSEFPSISEVVWEVAEWPAAVFLCGFLAGHWFWR